MRRNTCSLLQNRTWSRTLLSTLREPLENPPVRDIQVALTDESLAVFVWKCSTEQLGAHKRFPPVLPGLPPPEQGDEICLGSAPERGSSSQASDASGLVIPPWLTCRGRKGYLETGMRERRGKLYRLNSSIGLVAVVKCPSYNS
jgi:hypothetical protein